MAMKYCIVCEVNPVPRQYYRCDSCVEDRFGEVKRCSCCRGRFSVPELGAIGVVDIPWIPAGEKLCANCNRKLSYDKGLKLAGDLDAFRRTSDLR